jgi:dolichol kinase
MLMVEILKYKVDFIYGIYVKFFSVMLRTHEVGRKKFRMNGATWLLTADVVTIILFPKYIAITGMLLLSLSDSFSGIVGRLYGKKHYAKNRSYVGTITFFLIGLLIALFTPKYFYSSTEYFIAAAAVFLTTIADSLNLPADDNLVIPIVSSAFLYVLYIIFFPGIFG